MNRTKEQLDLLISGFIRWIRDDVLWAAIVLFCAICFIMALV